MTRDPRLHFPSKGSHTHDFYALKTPSIPTRFEPANLGSSGECDNHGTTGVDLSIWHHEFGNKLIHNLYNIFVFYSSVV